MLCAQVTDPEMFVFAERLVAYLGPPAHLSASATEISLTWAREKHKCVISLNLCGCAVVLGGEIYKQGFTWEFDNDCVWRTHQEHFNYVLPDRPTLN